MLLRIRNAFSMLELIFIIIIIGILFSVAVPRFVVTRDDAMIIKAKTTIASVRSAMAREKQRRILEGKFTDIVALDSGKANLVNSPIFDKFDREITTSNILEYPLITCVDANARGCWIRESENYVYRMPSVSNVLFKVINNRFICMNTDKRSSANCKLLTQ